MQGQAGGKSRVTSAECCRVTSRSDRPGTGCQGRRSAHPASPPTTRDDRRTRGSTVSQRPGSRGTGSRRRPSADPTARSEPRLVAIPIHRQASSFVNRERGLVDVAGPGSADCPATPRRSLPPCHDWCRVRRVSPTTHRQRRCERSGRDAVLWRGGRHWHRSGGREAPRPRDRGHRQHRAPGGPCTAFQRGPIPAGQHTQPSFIARTASSVLEKQTVSVEQTMQVALDGLLGQVQGWLASFRVREEPATTWSDHVDLAIRRASRRLPRGGGEICSPEDGAGRRPPSGSPRRSPPSRRPCRGSQPLRGGSPRADRQTRCPEP